MRFLGRNPNILLLGNHNEQSWTCEMSLHSFYCFRPKIPRDEFDSQPLVGTPPVFRQKFSTWVGVCSCFRLRKLDYPAIYARHFTKCGTADVQWIRYVQHFIKLILCSPCVTNNEQL